MESRVSWLPAFNVGGPQAWRGVSVEVPWIDRSRHRSCATTVADPSLSTVLPMRKAFADIIDMIDRQDVLSRPITRWAVRRR